MLGSLEAVMLDTNFMRLTVAATTDTRREVAQELAALRARLRKCAGLHLSTLSASITVHVITVSVAIPWGRQQPACRLLGCCPQSRRHPLVSRHLASNEAHVRMMAGCALQ